jgi:excinuclease UvrABC helicase subunit UvrB
MFKLHSEYKPTGDQPEAIDYLVSGINKGKKFHNGKYNRKNTKTNFSFST